MERFYARIDNGSGVGPAAAMRLAQADVRREFPHPYYWAPFLVIGRP
jgi:CHAT domain-containing protein